MTQVRAGNPRYEDCRAISSARGPLNATTTVVYYLYEQAFENLNMGYANAVGMVLFVIILIFSILNLRFFEKGVAPS